MHSSTSSSDRCRRCDVEKSHLYWGAGTLLLLCVVTNLVWNVTSNQASGFEQSVPSSFDYYLGVRQFPYACADCFALYYGQYGTVEPLKAADVLLLGNSRLMFAFPQDPTRECCERLGLSYYVLGFANGEGGRFPLDIIRKFDLRPKYVIINADMNFFANSYSPYVHKNVLGHTPFEAQKILGEEFADEFFETRLHKVLPHFLARTGGLVLYRSRQDGTWHTPTKFPDSYPIVAEQALVKPLERWQVEQAAQVKSELEQRGSQVIFTFVPWAVRSDSPDNARQLARHLDVPFIAPDLANLNTCDGSHLDRESAVRFSTAFFAELEQYLQTQRYAPNQPDA